jgi:adenylate cyclase
VARAYLIVSLAGLEKIIPLEEDAVCRIGRIPENTLVLPDRMVSRHHAAVMCAPGGEFQLTNLGSVNGTTLNGVLVNATVPLKSGDIIRIGDHQIRFEQELSATTPVGDFDATRVRVVEEIVSVLVVDLRDFTGLSQRLGENGTSEVVGTFLRETGKLLADRGSWNTKFIGDAVMGVWRHESREASQAAEILSILTVLANVLDVVSGLQTRFGLGEAVRAGAGLNTGPAALGNMGTDAQHDFTVIGDVVNKAFRLEAATRTTGTDVAMGDSTYQILRSSVIPDMVACHPVKLKGYEGLQHAWCLSHANLHSIVNAARDELST